MPELSLHKDNYVVVNVWTSCINKALHGHNVGHVSLETSTHYMSLWPGRGRTAGFFSYASPAFAQDYDEDCLQETLHESADYEFCLKGYQLCRLEVDEDHMGKLGAHHLSANKIYLELVPAFAFDSQERSVGQIHLTLNEDTLSYTFTNSKGDCISGSFAKSALIDINPGFAELEVPLTEKQLKQLQKYYFEIVQLMPEEHYLMTQQFLIQYTVKAPSGFKVKNIITDELLLGSRNLVDALLEGVDQVSLQLYLPQILEITFRNGHTCRHESELPIESRRIYWELSPDNELLYTVKQPSRAIVTAAISLTELEAIHPYLAALTAPLDLPKLHTLQQFTHAILAITADRGHTKKLLIRESCSTMPLQHGESLYRYHSGPQSYHPVSEVPEHYNDDEKYLAIHLTQANFRVVLYSLDSASVIQEINSLKSKSKVDSWTMRGSNFLTRNLSKQTAENCASIVYRCLRAGGFPTFF